MSRGFVGKWNIRLGNFREILFLDVTRMDERSVLVLEFVYIVEYFLSNILNFRIVRSFFFVIIINNI